MIILSKLADYGVIIATSLASANTQTSTLQIAAETRLSAATVAKVLKLMAKSGLVTSMRGAAGGYRLARPATEIKISEIVAAIDGDIALTQCLAHERPCTRHDFCQTKPHWLVINRAVEQALSGVTLAEMSRPSPSAFRTTNFLASSPIVAPHPPLTNREAAQ